MSKPSAYDVGRLIVVIASLFYTGYCAKLYVTCEGHVLKNSLDWPVCVK